MIGEAYQRNLEVLRDAFADENIALVECIVAETGKPVIVVCAVIELELEKQFVPLAKMFDGNPYEEVIPPAMDRPVNIVLPH